MKLERFLLLLAIAGLSSSYAQSPGGALIPELVKHWQSSKTLSLAVAGAMPESGYTFKASDAEMSFGEQMNHIALANASYCSSALGSKSPLSKGDDNTKATATKNLGIAYDYCIDGLQKLSESDLQATVQRQGNSVSKFELFWGGFTHAAHHRGQAEVYLRLKNITPPSYKF